MKVVVLIAVLLTAACGRSEPSKSDAVVPAPPPATRAADAPHDSASPARPRIVFLGDSLTGGLGLGADQSYPSLIGKRLQQHGYDYEVVNAGVSGDTSAGGMRRL